MGSLRAGNGGEALVVPAPSNFRPNRVIELTNLDPNGSRQDIQVFYLFYLLANFVLFLILWISNFGFRVSSFYLYFASALTEMEGLCASTLASLEHLPQQAKVKDLRYRRLLNLRLGELFIDQGLQRRLIR